MRCCRRRVDINVGECGFLGGYTDFFDDCEVVDGIEHGDLVDTFRQSVEREAAIALGERAQVLADEAHGDAR